MSDRTESSGAECWSAGDERTARRCCQALVETVDGGVFRLDVDDRFVAVDDTFLELTGYSCSELLGERLATVLPSLEPAQFEEAVRGHRPDGTANVVPLERTLRTAAGDTVRCDLRLTRLRADGRTAEFVGIVRPVEQSEPSAVPDQPKSTAVESTAMALETTVSEILGRVSDAFYALDESWRFTHVNERAEELLGHSSDDLVGERIWEVFPGGKRSELADRYQEAMATQESISWERYSQSLELWMEIQVYPSETGLSVYFRDITARKRRERQLERYERIIETIDDGIYVLDEDDRFVAVNDAYTELTGYDRDELLGAPASLISSEPALEQTKQLATDDNEPSTLETTLETKDGTPVPIEATVTTISTAEHTAPDAAVGTSSDTPRDGERTRADAADGSNKWAGIVRDVTEREAYQRELEASNERLEQFAYAASHDLQEPLRMVSSYLRLLERRYDDALDDDGLEFLEYAVDGAERMSAMIDGLLEYSRVETRAGELEPVDLEAVFEDAREDLALRIDEQEADVTVSSLPCVRGDGNQLRQVFQNLLSNAFEYSGDEPPRVHVSAEQSGSEWIVSVRDEGIGIDPDETTRIFEVFQRLHTHDEHPGTGIGLALCRRIVERHGGDIWVETEPGAGATFSMTLPAVDDPESCEPCSH
ncbi:PAS domain-containing sensor histidine kinase [Natronorubrum sulfidifaciens]|nr:PAS domain S-box protein [Natronorubrum sulfidifaciens]